MQQSSPRSYPQQQAEKLTLRRPTVKADHPTVILVVKRVGYASSLWLLAVSFAFGAPPPLKEANQPSPNTVFLCKDGGVSIYTNTKLNKACKTFALGIPISSKAPASLPSNSAGEFGSSAHAAFPRISEATQKVRDTDRKRILEDELANEQKSLEQAKKELMQQESTALAEEKNYKKITERLQPFRERIGQHERNIQTLRKEMANLK